VELADCAGISQGGAIVSEENKGLWTKAFNTDATFCTFNTDENGRLWDLKYCVTVTNPDNKDETIEFDSIDTMSRQIFKLQAENKRLRKAGDAMIEEWWIQLSCPERMKASWLKEPQIVEWRAAKGGQS